MVNLNKYKWTPWSISRNGFNQIAKALDRVCFPLYPLGNIFITYNIVEFGSGASTLFIEDYLRMYELDNVNFVSFENDVLFAARIDSDNVRVRPLLTCDDKAFEDMLSSGVYEPERMKVNTEPPTSRQRNCFYDIKDGDLPDCIDFMLVDGPNGNGRSLAFLHTRNRIYSGSILFIDDYDHYDFLGHLRLYHDFDVLYRSDKKKDKFVILEVK